MWKLVAMHQRKMVLVSFHGSGEFGGVQPCGGVLVASCPVVVSYWCPALAWGRTQGHNWLCDDKYWVQYPYKSVLRMQGKLSLSSKKCNSKKVG